MALWEYKIARFAASKDWLALHEYSGIWAWDAEVTRWLNQLGLGGWELVDKLNYGHGWDVSGLFKRELPQETQGG